jgi:MFS family permease
MTRILRHRRQLLGRWSVKRYAPFAFSIAQCAIPAGILLTGYLGPLTAQSFGWRDTMLASAALCWAVALILQPLRGRLDTESSARHPIRLSDLRTTITAVLAVRERRSLSFACFAFNGTQAVFVAYFVTYMTSQGHPLVAAGSLYSTVIAVALPGRILWAWVGGFYVAPHLVLGGLAFGIAASIGLIGAFTPHWPLLAIGAVDNGGQRHGNVLARHHAVGSRASGAAGTSGRGYRWGAVIRPDRRAVQSRGLLVAARAVWWL